MDDKENNEDNRDLVEKTEDILKEGVKIVIAAINTPLEVFLFFLLIGAVALSFFASLAGPCGSIKEISQNVDSRLTTGAIVVTKNQVAVDNVEIDSFICAVVENVDEEEGVAKIKILSKPVSQEFLSVANIESQEDYSFASLFSAFIFSPGQVFSLFNQQVPSGYVEINSIRVVPTHPFSVFVRSITFDIIYVVMFILVLIASVFFYFGSKAEKLRARWYRFHTLRSYYRSQLAKNRAEKKELIARWEQVELSLQEDKKELWNSALRDMQEILDTTLVNIGFPGDSIEDRVANLTEKDLFVYKEFIDKYAKVVAILRNIDNDEIIVTYSDIEQIRDCYKETLIWLGLLLHKPL